MFEPTQERGATFWPKVLICAADECWPWQSYCDPARGYGRWAFGKGQVVRAHRAAWMLLNEQQVPAGLCVCHRCDNPPCCNPAHLFLGTVADNNRDRAAKGRTVRGWRDESKTARRHGEAHHSAKLTEADVRAIRSDPRSLSQMAAVYGIGEAAVSRIRNRKTWKAVP